MASARGDRAELSNMGYITTLLTADERRRAGPKNGAQATATVALDPGGAVSVHIASTPQGQGHRTVAAQIVADAFGLAPCDIAVTTELDTVRDAWSIASGNYSPVRCRRRRRGRACGGPAARKAAAQRRGLAQCAGERDRVRGWKGPCPRQSGQRPVVRARRGGQPLVARHGAG